MTRISESEVEDAALAWLAGLGFAVLHGPDIGPEGSAPERGSYDEVLLPGRLHKALSRLNQAYLTKRWGTCCARYDRRRPPHSSRKTAACTATSSKAYQSSLRERTAASAAMSPG